ncbi:MAG: hypothetical protein K8U57_02620 [Planctomycetes bacterium]|nr:hypothetical protein [Planctomycetota bacterium]
MTHKFNVGLMSAVVLLCGCSSGNYNDGLNMGGTLSGTVTLDGTPLRGGRVECYADNGKYSVMADLDKAGKFTLKEPPLGACKLVVKTSHLKNHPAAMSPNTKDSKGNPGGSAGMVIPTDIGFGYTQIPEKYENLATTDQTVTVERGDTTHDIKLTK